MKPETLKSRQEIKDLFQKGKKERLFPLTAIYRENGKQANRILFCTERGIKRAVDRNRIKRLCREFISHSEFETQGLDIAIIANLSFSSQPAGKRNELLVRLFKKFMK